MTVVGHHLQKLAGLLRPAIECGDVDLRHAIPDTERDWNKSHGAAVLGCGIKTMYNPLNRHAQSADEA